MSHTHRGRDWPRSVLSLGAPGTLTADAYQLAVYAPAIPANTFYVRARNLRIRAESAAFTLAGTAAQIPRSATLLAPKIWRSNNATALTLAFDTLHIYTETEF